jgi:hypothetical protein
LKVFLHLRKGISGRQFVTSLAKQIRAGEHKTWEVAKTRPLTIRHKGRFKASILLTPSGGRASPDHPAPDVAARLTGRDAGFVLRYLTWLLAIKLKHQIAGFYVRVDDD